MNRRSLYAVLLALFLLACGVAWHLFRPEKAFIDNPVNEPPPPGVPAGNVSGASPAHSAGQY